MRQVKVVELTQQTDTAIEQHLQHELLAAKGRAADIIAPFASLVDDAESVRSERARMLRYSRQALDELALEAQRMAHEGGTAET